MLQKRKIGNTALEVTVVGVGCNNFGDRMDFPATQRVVDKALDIGITLFDTADAYGRPTGGSEEALGRILGERRKSIVLATKFGLPMDDGGKGGSRAYVMQAVEASLRRLKTDWIDLYQMHKPDPATPIEETLRALDDLVEQGKVRHIGNSNFSAAQIREAADVAKQNGLTPFVSGQDQYSLLARRMEREVLPEVKAQGLGFFPYFPLASGMLTGKYKGGTEMPEGSRLSYSKRHIERFVHDEMWTMVRALEDFCAKRGRSMLEMAFGWLLANPNIPSVIAGASKPEQIEQNAKAAGWTLSADDVAELNRITESALDWPKA